MENQWSICEGEIHTYLITLSPGLCFADHYVVLTTDKISSFITVAKRARVPLEFHIYKREGAQDTKSGGRRRRGCSA